MTTRLWALANLMITTLFTGFITSALLFSTTISAPQGNPVALTTVLPVANVMSYTTNSGDTLETIARDQYGDVSYWKTLWNDNQWITDPNDIPHGQRITIRVNKPEKPDEAVIALQKTESKESSLEQKKVVAVASASLPTVIPTTAPVVVTPPSSFEDVYKTAGAKYGVPWQILYGLHITETGGRDGTIMNHGGSGARGPMQFMPGTWNAYGVDGNGDGTADIDNAVDAINGAANYLAKHGSLASGLRSYGGNTVRTLELARAKGYAE
jgi:LysM repeat protein